MVLQEIAERAEIPLGLRPYFYDAAKTAQHQLATEWDVLASSVLPLLIRIITTCELHASPDELTKAVVSCMHRFIDWQTVPGNFRIPRFRVQTPFTDKHAAFLGGLTEQFMKEHPEMVSKKAG